MLQLLREFELRKGNKGNALKTAQIPCLCPACTQPIDWCKCSVLAVGDCAHRWMPFGSRNPTDRVCMDCEATVQNGAPIPLYTDSDFEDTDSQYDEEHEAAEISPDLWANLVPKLLPPVACDDCARGHAPWCLTCGNSRRWLAR